MKPEEKYMNCKNIYSSNCVFRDKGIIESDTPSGLASKFHCKNCEDFKKIKKNLKGEK